MPRGIYDRSQTVSKPDDANRVNRPKRTPLGMRNVLTAEQRPGFVRRWVNDVDDRLQRFKDAGYTQVLSSKEVGDPKAGADSQMGSLVAKGVGGGTRAVLMEIPDEFYREDQVAKQKRVDATEAGLRRQPGIKGQQYGSTYGKLSITSRGETRELGAESGEAD